MRKGEFSGAVYKEVHVVAEPVARLRTERSGVMTTAPADQNTACRASSQGQALQRRLLNAAANKTNYQVNRFLQGLDGQLGAQDSCTAQADPFPLKKSWKESEPLPLHTNRRPCPDLRYTEHPFHGF